jgi:hypothetical protein
MAGIELIDSVALTSDVASVTFSDIPDTYGSLRILCNVKSAWGGGFYDSFDWLWLQVNTTTQSCYSIDGITPSGNGANTGWFQLNNIAHNGSLAQSFAACEIDLHGYNNTSMGCGGISQGGTLGYSGGGGYVVINDDIVYSMLTDRAKITSISLKCRLGNTKSGSRFDLYGLTI